MTDTAIPLPRRSRRLAEFRTLAGLALAVLGFQSLVAKHFYIPSESMMPTLLVGDRLIVSKWPYGWSYTAPVFHLMPFEPGRLFGRLPARGDVVIVTPPDPARRGEDLIKRVIGLPGDTVEMRHGRLLLNGATVPAREEGYRRMPARGAVRVIRETLPGGASYDTIDLGRSERDEFPSYKVPAGYVFLMGDNRDNSADSRLPVSQGGLGGAVPVENIGGRAEFVTMSLNGTATWNPATWPAAVRGGRSGLSLRR